jgi:hypothetical protein
MKVLLAIFVAVPLYFVGSLFLLQTIYPGQTYRYRLSILPEIDGQVRKASSVIEVTAEESPFGGGGATLRGQAPYLDLGERGVLIFSLGNDYDSDNARAALWLGAKAFGNDSSIPNIYKLPSLTGRRDLSPDLIPVAVWFSTPGDLTVRRALLPQDFAGAFGPGAQIASANVEITRDPVVIDIDKKLPLWLSALTAKTTGLVISGPDWAAPTNVRRHHLLRNDENSPSFIVRLFAAGVVLPLMPFWSKRASCPDCQRR